MSRVPALFCSPDFGGFGEDEGSKASPFSGSGVSGKFGTARCFALSGAESDSHGEELAGL